MIIAQISDTHITNPQGRMERIYQTSAYLERAVSHLNSLPMRPEIVLVTGDCTDGGTIAEYHRLRELLEPLTMPVLLIPGNHDNRNNILEVFGQQGSKHMES